MAESRKQAFELAAKDVPMAGNGLDAPTLYAEDIRGLVVVNGMAKLNLIENRVDTTTDQITAKHVATLVVPLGMLRNWGPFLVEHLGSLEVAGSDGE